MANFKLNSKLLLIVSIFILHLYPDQQVESTFMDPTELTQDRQTKCDTKPIRDLNDKCDILKFYNQSKVDNMAFENTLHSTIQECMCQLIRMDTLWEQAFDHPITRRVSRMVDSSADGSGLQENGTYQWPEYLWSDIDVTIFGISIYTSTKDFFDQKRVGLQPKKGIDQVLVNDDTYTSIKNACVKIARDPFKLYRYLENLIRASPVDFARLIYKEERIDFVYQFSKACKFLLLPNIQDYKLRPDNSAFVSVEPSILEPPKDSDNMIQNDLDTELSSPSMYLMNCQPWQRKTSSIAKLGQDCPMMLMESKHLPTVWVKNYTTTMARSQIAIECACQLLLHNSTWANIMRDPNVQIMARALTEYMNENRVPNFGSSPIITLYGWFEEVMRTFKDKNNSIKQISKAKTKDQDPTIVIGRDIKEESLELLRRGCNYIVFNYNKGSKEAKSELYLIRYLDNLQLFTQDPTFVFHLTLQDSNLFKLHALSKICKPFVR